MRRETHPRSIASRLMRGAAALALVVTSACGDDARPLDPEGVLDLSLAASEIARPGGQALLALMVTNTSSRPFALSRNNESAAFDIVVRSLAGDMVFHILSGPELALAPPTVLPGGQSTTFSFPWSLQNSSTGAPVPPGEYVVTGKLVLAGRDPKPAPGSATVRVVPD